MASDEMPSSDGPPPIRKPPRDPNREPTVIDATAVSGPEDPAARPEKPVAEGPAESRLDDGSDVPPADARESLPPPAPRRRALPSLLLPLGGLAAVFILAALAFVAWQDADMVASTQADTSDLRRRLEKLEAAAGRVGPSAAEVATLERRLTALEQRPSPVASVTASPNLAALELRLSAAEKTARDAAAAAATAQRAAEARPGPQAAPVAVPAPAVDLGPLERRLSALDARLAPLEEQLAAPKTVVRATETPVEPGSRPGDSAALAVVAQSLALAIDRGRPFATEIAAAAAVGADSALLAPLKPLAEKGAPTRAVLTRSFDDVSDQILAAGKPAGEPGGLFDRLSASAAKLVRVRPVGEATGGDPSALVVQIETALDRGNTAQAIAAWDKLPEASKAVSSAFIELARRRVAAEGAARALLQTAMTQLARPRDSQ